MTFFFFSTRPPPGLLPVLGPLGSGTDATHQPKALPSGSWVVGDHGSNVNLLNEKLMPLRTKPLRLDGELTCGDVLFV